MRCKSIRVKTDRAEADETRHVVSMIVGNLRQVGRVDEVAWVEMSPGMAREIAIYLNEAADEVQRLAKQSTS